MDYQLGPGPLQVDQNTIDEKIKGDIGIVENGDVATHAIPSGYYVIWKGDLYVAKTDISSGTTLSAASNGNLTAKPNGLGAEVAALNSNLTLLDSNSNSTTDILADAVNCTHTQFFKGSGSDYTGILPATDSTYRYATFIVNYRAPNLRTVIAHSLANRLAINTYNGSWSGWHELVTDSDTIKYMDITDTSPVNVNSKSGQTITINNFVGCATRTNDVMPLPYMNNNIQYIKLVNFNDFSVYSGSATIRVWYR